MQQEFVSRPAQKHAMATRILGRGFALSIGLFGGFLLLVMGVTFLGPRLDPSNPWLLPDVWTWSELFAPPIVLYVIAGIPLIVLVSLLYAWLSAEKRTLNAYRKAVRKSLERTMQSYYHPENAPDLNSNEEKHLMVLGLPGSGKTKSLEHFLYEATASPVSRKNYQIPVLIQMKYYNGFLRQYQNESSNEPNSSPTEDTWLTYLLSDKHTKETQGKKEPELIGMHHLRPYLGQLIRQKRLVLLCDGMNELGHDVQLQVRDELSRLMESENRVIMSCRELEYQEQDWLRDLTEQGAIPKMLPALSENDVPQFVNRYLQGQNTGKDRRNALSSAEIEQISQQIGRINRPHRYSSPFMLIMLIQALQNLEGLDEQQAQTITRGQLLQISVDQRLEDIVSEEQKTSKKRKSLREQQALKEEVQHFFSVIACTARHNQQRNALQIASTKRSISRARLAEDLTDWLNDNGADVSSYTLEKTQHFLTIAQDAGLITISSYGVLSFMHELIAEYFAAEYLRYIYYTHPQDERFWRGLYESEEKASGLWSEPVALWAGLKRGAHQEVATFLVEWASTYGHAHHLDEYDPLYYHALALSLACVGVSSPVILPAKTALYLTRFVGGQAERAKLARIFKRCADEGGSEVYEALLPHLKIKGLADLFLELHELYGKTAYSSIPTLLFDYLEKVIGSAPESVEPKLISLLGELGRRNFGDVVHERALRASADTSESSALRTATLRILGLIKNAADVPYFINYLYDKDKQQLIAGSAIRALASCGPALTLTALKEAEQKARNPAFAQVRLNIAHVLQEFLKEEEKSPDMAVSAPYDAQLIGLLIQFLSQLDGELTHEIVLNLLNHQIKQKKERVALVIDLLLHASATPDAQMASFLKKLLQENCELAFPQIRAFWETPFAVELAQVRLIAVLGNAHVARTQDFLLKQIDNPAADIQQALAHAFSLHQPESIQPLLMILLSSTASESAMKVALLALEEIGEECVKPLSYELSRISTHAHAQERGLLKLVNLLDTFRERGLILVPADTAVVSALNILFTWLMKNTRYGQLITQVVQVMIGFRNVRVVPPLIRLLGRSDPLLGEACAQAVEGLSQLGEMAFGPLIDALDGPRDALTARRARQAIVGMQPFPFDRLLASLRDSRLTVVQQVRQIFAANAEIMDLSAPFLISHLLDDAQLSHQVQQALKEIEPEIAVPYLVKALGKADWQSVLEKLLLTCPARTIVIHQLVLELGNEQRSGAISSVLLHFKFQEVLPWLTGSLANPNSGQNTRRLIVHMIDRYREQRAALLKQIVALFDPSATLPARPDISSEERAALRNLLTHELADISLPALIDGLQEKPLMEDCKLALVALADIQERRDEVVEAVLQALYAPTKRRGAHETLVRCGAFVAERVCELLMDKDGLVADEACQILADMEQTAFPFIHRLAHDPKRLDDAKKIFKMMSRPAAAKGLLSFLASANTQETEIAFYLLLQGVKNSLGVRDEEIIKNLLRETREQQDSDLALRVLSSLVFFYNGSQNHNGTQMLQRKNIAEFLIEAANNGPEHHTELMRTLLLLGDQAQGPLVQTIKALQKPGQGLFLSEALGIASQLGASSEVVRYLEQLTTHTSEPGAGLRALGGLLASGNYGPEELAERRDTSKARGDLASFEFYDVLLGQRHMPELDTLTRKTQQQLGTIQMLERQIQQLEVRSVAAENRASGAEERARSAEERVRYIEKLYESQRRAQNNSIR